jgi:DNA-binding NtrC family response regulator
MARILIIDDEEDIRLTVRLALESMGHEVTEAVNGNEGLSRFSAEKNDLVITDILMPDKEGIETIIELRKMRPDLKIIVMSGGGRINATHVLETAKGFGADFALKKPFSIDALCSTVDSCLAGPA